MTPTERRQRILAATCEGCSNGLPPMKYEGQQVHYRQEIAHRTLLMRCTANHALADEVEGWIREASSFELTTVNFDLAMARTHVMVPRDLECHGCGMKQPWRTPKDKELLSIIKIKERPQ